MIRSKILRISDIMKNIHTLSLLILVTSLSMHASAWIPDSIKNYAKKIAYHIMPASYSPKNWMSNNFHQVTNHVFRSKTMTAKSLARYVDKKKIKGILILRDNGFNDYWYQKEKEVADDKGVALHRVVLDERVLPSKEDLAKILQIIKTYKKENKALLIHCAAGVDRAGLIAALCELYEGKPVSVALKQLSFTFGHCAWFLPHMREAVKQLGALQKEHGGLEEAIEHFPQRAFNPPALPIRLFHSLKDLVKAQFS
jgi:protein-tyrosine phosphatase